MKAVEGYENQKMCLNRTWHSRIGQDTKETLHHLKLRQRVAFLETYGSNARPRRAGIHGGHGEGKAGGPNCQSRWRFPFLVVSGLASFSMWARC